jgi:hypothetical protein
VRYTPQQAQLGGAVDDAEQAAAANSRLARPQTGSRSASDLPCAISDSGPTGPEGDRTQMDEFKPRLPRHELHSEWRPSKIYKRNNRVMHNYEGVFGLLQISYLQPDAFLPLRQARALRAPAFKWVECSEMSRLMLFRLS